MVAELLCDVFNRLGMPDEILTDRGSGFVSRMLRYLYKVLSISSITTTPYHTQTDGMVERLNGTVKTMLKRSKSAFKGQWDIALPFVMGECRSCPNRTMGFSPAELLYGQQLRTPLQVMKDSWTGKQHTTQPVVRYLVTLTDDMERLREREKKLKLNYKEHYDRKNNLIWPW